ncbi:MAG TPA: hypothetical protein VNN73_17695 [Blastocatellia bacterium]|nr:hypothetical protein [Blastocatellia bacterium]
MLSKAYVIIGVIVIALYAMLAFTGTEIGSPEKERVSARDVRSSHGSRIFFWHSGYRGGK